MKKGKYLFLLAAVLSLLFIFVACNGGETVDTSSGTETDAIGSGTGIESTSETDEADTGNETVSGTETEASESETAEATESETVAPHEIHNYFDVVKSESTNYTEIVSRLDGELVSLDTDNNLAVIREKDLDTMNNVITTMKVINIISGEEIHNSTVSNQYNAPAEEVTNLSISIDYPLIQVVRTYANMVGEGYETAYNVDYYLAASEGSEYLYGSDNTDYELVEVDNGLVRVKIDKKIWWIDKNLDIVRTVNAIASTGYDIEAFKSEYKGYIYTWTDAELMIFNRSGICCAVYTAGQDSFIKCHVLNNGNVLVQEFTRVTAYDICDFVLNGTRYTFKSSIVNFINGETAEVDLEFVVDELETKYYQRAAEENTLVLKKGYENSATVYGVANGYIAKYADIVVVDNELNVLFTLANDTVGVNLAHGLFALTDDLYYTVVNEGSGNGRLAIFDLYGNEISYMNYICITLSNGYIVTGNAIYDARMNVVFDYVAEGYTLVDIDYYNGRAVYFEKPNYRTGGTESYRFKTETGDVELLADGVNTELWTKSEHVYVVYDEENDVYIAYNNNDVELIVSHERLNISYYTDDATVISTNLEGDPIIYVVK